MIFYPKTSMLKLPAQDYLKAIIRRNPVLLLPAFWAYSATNLRLLVCLKFRMI